ncbi:unnamed protein product [Caenorhabditis angaria]|uniref:receptor protein-tyrosine kinase n=1 Tax=Caenorhabditis angaria TaxID=860376 RepID=A0A9P1ILW1_9PELO|nr:unnamed protein product [Caenorhabditis angaria]
MIIARKSRKRRRNREEEGSLHLPTTSSTQNIQSSDYEDYEEAEETAVKINNQMSNENENVQNSTQKNNQVRKQCSSLRWLSIPAWLFLIIAILIKPSNAIIETRCGSIDIRNTPMGLKRSNAALDLGDSDSIKSKDLDLSNQINCTVIEGSFLITMISTVEGKNYSTEDFPRFPYLREITGSLMIFDAGYLKTLSWILPNLRVIGGQVLIQQYALVIYKNNDLEDIGLNNLKVIRNGGVRITDNKRLCHTRLIDWKHITTSAVNDVLLDDAAELSFTETGRICKKGGCVSDPNQDLCHYMEVNDKHYQSCWSDTNCQRTCKFDRIGEEIGPGCDPDGEKCHDECLGGCDKKDDASACHSCKNYHYQGRCVPTCGNNLYVLINRRCVTKEKCLALKPIKSKSYLPIKAINGVCSDKCPEGYEEDPKDNSTCLKCAPNCQVICPTTIVDSYHKALQIKNCHVIDGNLLVEVKARADSGSAISLQGLFSKIHTITGYLQVHRSPSFLNLFMFKNLRVIEGRELTNGYALSVMENANLKKLFDPSHDLKILRGKIRFHNNRMLCFHFISQFMEKMGMESMMSELDQSLSSNGDKAVCLDQSFQLILDSTTSNSIQITWPQMNTTDTDHRKFLGYELFYKEVAVIDPNMSMDDDRSACSDSWHSAFIQSESEDSESTVTHILTEHLKPNQHYAIYVTTQVVVHKGARNYVSKILFATTKFAAPEPPIVTIQRVTSDEIELSWEPPIRPNGVITHYQINWRGIETDAAFKAEGFCTKRQYAEKNREEIGETTVSPLSTKAPSMESVFGGGNLKGDGTCSAMSGCCECPHKTPSIEQTESDSDFENDVHNMVFVQKCSFDFDPIRCASTWEQEVEEIDPEIVSAMEKTGKTSRRVRDLRADEEYELRKREMRRAVHVIRNSHQDYEAYSAFVIRRRRSIKSEASSGDGKNDTNKDPAKNRLHVTRKAGKNDEKDNLPENETITILDKEKEKKVQFEMEDDEKQVAFPLLTQNVTASKTGPTTFIIKNLKHFTEYAISVSACQDVNVPLNYCSPSSKAAKMKKTSPLMDVDRVLNETIKIDYMNTTSKVRITWKTPNNSNGGILGYYVHMRNLAVDASLQTECQPAVANWTSEIDGVIFKHPPDGEYSVEVIAYSMYAPSEPAIALEKVVIHTPGFWTLNRIIVAVLIILIFLLFAGLITYNIIKKYYGKKVKAMADFMSHNPEYVIEEVYKEDEWELQRETLELLEEIGMGTFGKVYRGFGHDVVSNNGCTFGECAIKTVQDKANGQERLHFLLEANVMKGFNAPFIVKLFGVVSRDQPTLCVMELMALGNLRDYLRSRRPGAEENTENLPVPSKEQYHEWASQIADGMAYLESIKFCHRDLAARNCMVRADETVKIGDFGMARDIYYHDYYKPTGKRLMPVRWMAPESLKDAEARKRNCLGAVSRDSLYEGATPSELLCQLANPRNPGWQVAVARKFNRQGSSPRR